MRVVNQQLRKAIENQGRIARIEGLWWQFSLTARSSWEPAARPRVGSTMTASFSETFIDLYRRHATEWDAARRRSGWNDRVWINAFAKELVGDSRVLDLGCGGSEPVARFLVKKKKSVTVKLWLTSTRIIWRSAFASPFTSAWTTVFPPVSNQVTPLVTTLVLSPPNAHRTRAVKSRG